MKKLVLGLLVSTIISTSVFANTTSDFEAGKKAVEAKNYQIAIEYNATYYNKIKGCTNNIKPCFISHRR